MTFSAIIEIILGVLQFPSQVSQLIKMLKATPEEQREAIMKAVMAEADNFQKTGRPTWNS